MWENKVVRERKLSKDMLAYKAKKPALSYGAQKYE